MTDSPEESSTQDYGMNLQADGALGLFTVVALIFLVWGFCWLKSYSAFRIPQHINVLFHEVAALNQSAGVYVDGVRVGIVDKLQWQGRHQVLVQVSINAKDVTIPEGSKFLILTNGIVGAKFVEIVMPDYEEGKPPPPRLKQNATVWGEDPVRPELAVNNIAIGLSQIDMKELHDNFEADRVRLVRAADQLSILARKAMPVVDRALPLENEMIGLAKDTKVVSSRLSHFLGNPNLPEDLRKTAQEAKETMEIVESTMHELSMTLGDKEMRKDFMQTVDTLNKATHNIQNSVEGIQQIAGDKELRSDIKDMLAETQESLDEVEKIFCQPNFGTDLKGTLSQTRDTINNVDQVSKRLNQMLGKRFPLMHMMFGKPGRLKHEEPKPDNKKGKRPTPPLS